LLGEVRAVLVQCIELEFRRLVCDARFSAQFVVGLLDRLGRGAGDVQDLASFAFVARERDEQMLRRGIAVAHSLGCFDCLVDDLQQIVAGHGHGHAARQLGLGSNRIGNVALELRRVSPDALQDGFKIVFGGVEHRRQQVNRLDDAGVIVASDAHGSLESLGCRGTQFVKSHIFITFSVNN